MAKKEKKIILSSKKQIEIENAYKETARGRLIFTMMFVNTVIMLIGLLFAIYVFASELSGVHIDEAVMGLANTFLVFGGSISLVCLFFYISYSNNFKPNKTTGNETKTNKTDKVKKTTSKKNTKKTSTKKTTKK